MYNLSAEYYDAIYLAMKDYAAETGLLKQVIEAHLHSPGRQLLDIACGTGLHLLHLKDDFQAEGMDISPEMIEVARRRLPDTPLHVGDMVDFSL
ncbi:MAG: class I SAM-dependent methyltransferase, partial [Anaerolineaceae bacterium]